MPSARINWSVQTFSLHSILSRYVISGIHEVRWQSRTQPSLIASAESKANFENLFPKVKRRVRRGIYAPFREDRRNWVRHNHNALSLPASILAVPSISSWEVFGWRKRILVAIFHSGEVLDHCPYPLLEFCRVQLVKSPRRTFAKSPLLPCLGSSIPWNNLFFQEIDLFYQPSPQHTRPNDGINCEYILTDGTDWRMRISSHLLACCPSVIFPEILLPISLWTRFVCAGVRCSCPQISWRIWSDLGMLAVDTTRVRGF